MNKIELARYLKIGSTKDFEYSEPDFDFDYSITFEEAKEQFRELVHKRIKSFPIKDSFLYFSGTFGACVMLDLIKDIPTLSMNLDDNAKDISAYYGAKNYMFEWDDIEDMVLEHQTQYVSKDKPRCWSLDDIYGWVRARNAVNIGFRSAICEGGGAEWCLFGDPNRAHAVMELAVQRGEYKVTRAMQYRKNVVKRDHHMYSDYLKCYTERVSIFKDSELEELGLPIPEFKLRWENLKHLTQAAHDWGYHYIIKENDQPASDFFGGYDINYLFYDNEELVKFLMSLPMEMKYNLGRSKHIFKETFPLPENLPKLTQSVFKPIQDKIEGWANKAALKYLSKGNKIWDYLNYDTCQVFMNDFLKFWQLLNLSIWLEHND
jgi:hypothetical protein